MGEELTQNNIEDWKKDASWLIQEVQSLIPVIDQIPVDESLPGESSVLARLDLLNYLQKYCYNPLFDLASTKNEGPLISEDPDVLKQEFNPGRAKGKNITELLNEISDRRRELLEMAGNIPLKKWRIDVNTGGEKVSLFSYAKTIIEQDQKSLRQIGELAMLFQTDRFARRDLEKRRTERRAPLSHQSKPE